MGTPQDRAPTPDENDQALHFLRHHLYATLKNEYMGLRSPITLWTALKKRFEKLKYTILPQAEQDWARLKYTILPQAEQDWARLRFADFKSVAEYNSALHQICTNLSLCGKVVTDVEMIEKTLSTFHPSAMQSASNYRQASYKEYDEMIDIMQVSESHEEVLRKNFVSQPPGKSVGLEVNASSYKVRKPVQRKRGKCGGKKATEKSEGKAPATQGAQGGKGKKEAKPPRNDKPYGQQDQTCYKCGIWGHWSCICEEPPHVVDAYQASRKAKASTEAHMVDAHTTATPPTTTPLDAPAAAAGTANEKDVTQEQIFAELDTLVDSI
ncbi:hypothetical protein OsI_15100 [Oryza sativa Indica Group]|jgi:hypothetical protein|uniref:CCHC-type domain-containing protein n=1 Tax=Oryza sativa subsp. indica TaxID=39946 RepID=A2XR31_ORYSI|nr:hypothetical protein OsI_15100 [Oryza sativa Indica Group]